MDVSTAIFWALCALEDAMASNDNAGFHRLRFTQAYHELRRLNRRELRRARKAAKNLVMYKLAGRRPWRWVNQICGARYILKQQSPDILRWSLEAYDWDREDMQYPLSHLARRRNVHSHRIAWLRERSGFLDMSRVAEGIKQRRRRIDEVNGLLVNGVLFIPGDTGGYDAIIGVDLGYSESVSYASEQMAELIKGVVP